jgi:carboxypeptidase T
MRQLVTPQTARPVLAAIALLVVTGALTCRAHESHPARRVAIEVDCTDARACALAEKRALDVWSEERGPGLPLAVVVAEPDLDTLRAAGVPFTVLVDDIDAVARAEHDRLQATASISAMARPADWFAEYRDYRAITERIQALAASHPALARVEPIGASFESRTLWAIKIGGTATDATPMLLSGTQHAREWISPMVATCIADRLVNNYASDPAVRDFVDHTALWVVPVVNPDGYQYTWSNNRYWRKNRRGSHGVDLNRNWDLAWGGAGSSGSKLSDVYRGERPFSEPETAALRDLALREHIALHVDLHSFSQLLLYPWGYTATPAPDAARFAAVGDRLASAIYATHGVPYKLLSSVELYAAAGTMTDWMYGVAHAFSYTIELRPGAGGRSGFVLPPEQIRPTCDEAFAAILELRKAAR